MDAVIYCLPVKENKGVSYEYYIFLEGKGWFRRPTLAGGTEFFVRYIEKSNAFLTKEVAVAAARQEGATNIIFRPA